MPFLFLFLLILACLPDSWPPPDWLGLPAKPPLLAVLTWSGIAGITLAAYWQTRRLRRTLLRFPDRRESVLRRYGWLRLGHLLVLSVFYGLSLYLLGWGWTIRSLGPLNAASVPQLFPGAEILLLAPFVVGLLLSWILFYDMDRALQETSSRHRADSPTWGRGAYVRFQARQNLALIFVPILLLVSVKAVHRLFPESQASPAFQVVSFVVVGAVFIGLPWLLRLVLGLRPLPAGPLRERLVAASRRVRFRCSNILLWETHGTIANAMVAGLSPFLRYVLFTDRLLEELTPEEVEAVFGHEIGHVKHHHMLYYLAFLMASVVAVGGAWDLAFNSPTAQGSEGAAAVPPAPPVSVNQGEPPQDMDWMAVPFMASMGAYIFVVFGFLSRRCERQADLFGCKTVSCGRRDCTGHDESAVLLPEARGLCPTGIRTFIEALEKVGRLNGITRQKRGWLQSWLHSTIDRRVAFLQEVMVNPTREMQFQRTVGYVKWGLLLALSAGILFLWSKMGWERLRPF